LLIWIGSPVTDYHNFLFLDRDGVVNEDRPDYIKHWSEFKFYPDALEALRWLLDHKINVILISNQSALNRGLIGWGDFWEVHHRMIGSIRQNGGDLLAAVYCPHLPDEGCLCRKPSPQMVLTAAQIYRIPLGKSYMIGDRAKDVMAADQAGCHGILLDRLKQAGPPNIRLSGETVKEHGTLMEAVLAIPWEL
jgi:D-glycero-D-manno-heptose 1,7-bisphosphate phosphatase